MSNPPYADRDAFFASITGSSTLQRSDVPEEEPCGFCRELLTDVYDGKECVFTSREPDPAYSRLRQGQL